MSCILDHPFFLLLSLHSFIFIHSIIISSFFSFRTLLPPQLLSPSFIYFFFFSSSLTRKTSDPTFTLFVYFFVFFFFFFSFHFVLLFCHHHRRRYGPIVRPRGRFVYPDRVKACSVTSWPTSPHPIPTRADGWIGVSEEDLIKKIKTPRPPPGRQKSGTVALAHP